MMVKCLLILSYRLYVYILLYVTINCTWYYPNYYCGCIAIMYVLFMSNRRFWMWKSKNVEIFPSRQWLSNFHHVPPLYIGNSQVPAKYELFLIYNLQTHISRFIPRSFISTENALRLSPWNCWYINFSSGKSLVPQAFKIFDLYHYWIR